MPAAPGWTPEARARAAERAKAQWARRKQGRRLTIGRLTIHVTWRTA